MGIYSKIASDSLLYEQESAERVQNRYSTDKFYGGAEIVVIAKSDNEARNLEKLLIADFSKLKAYKESTLKENNITLIEYDGNDFRFIREGKDCGGDCAVKKFVGDLVSKVKPPKPDKMHEYYSDYLDDEPKSRNILDDFID